jgi:hypothetical protein
MIRRRPTQVFSMAFLDCICCGFGAVILIFVLSIGTQDKAKEKLLEDLRRLLAAQLASMVKLRASKEDLERTNARAASLVVDARLKNDALHSLLADLDKKIQYEKKGQEALLVDIDELKKEIAARQKKAEVVLNNTKPTPVGVPVGSNYLAFIIDTSGSMRDPATDRIWSSVIKKVDEVLDAYPQVEGVQVLDADGRFILGRGSEQWLADSPEVRAGIKQAIRRYDVATNSNSVPGIMRAIRTLHDAKNDRMKMGIYVFGDEFTGTSPPVIKRLEELNPADEKGERKVVINAIGFPTTIEFTLSMDNTGLKMSNLMREVTYSHGGAFIALTDLR